MPHRAAIYYMMPASPPIMRAHDKLRIDAGSSVVLLVFPQAHKPALETVNDDIERQ